MLHAANMSGPLLALPTDSRPRRRDGPLGYFGAPKRSRSFLPAQMSRLDVRKSRQIADARACRWVKTCRDPTTRCVCLLRAPRLLHLPEPMFL
jgi:hypothetical protein